MNRYDFVYIFDVTDGNPNGDPDAGNLPRTDPETGQGLVTDVCLKRKIRNFVGLVKNETPPYEIYVKEKAILNDQQKRAYIAMDIAPKKKKKGKKKDDQPEDKKDKEKLEEDLLLTKWMCSNFYDVRTFGAVMTTGTSAGVNCGQVRGPIQLSFARSIDPIVSLEHALSVCAARTAEKTIKEQTGIQGRKFTVPYALYRASGFINPFLAEQTGFGDEDLELFKNALAQMFEYDRSAARGQMVPRACIAFKHAQNLGNARADQLFDRVTCALKSEVTDDDRPSRKFADYDLNIDESDLPDGISVERWV